MPMPELKLYAIKDADGNVVGSCQGWPWMIPEAPAGCTLEEMSAADGLPPQVPPEPSDELPPLKT
jgi:hypothetical protein